MNKSDLLSIRSTGLMIFSVQFANPNGSPDFEGRPRVLNDRRGMVTDVSIKRKIRDILVDHRKQTFLDIKQQLGFDPDCFHVWESLNRGYDDAENQIDAVDRAKRDYFPRGVMSETAFFRRFWDVRCFGIASFSETSANEGNRINVKRTGVITMRPGISVGPLDIDQPQSITKLATLQDDNMLKEVGTIAPAGKKFVTFGLFAMPFGVNPHFAKETRTVFEDVLVFKTLLKHTFNCSQSCSRPAGSIQLIHIWWKDHTNSLGSFNEWNWWNALHPKLRDGVDCGHSLDDFIIPEPLTAGPTTDTIDLLQ